MTPVPVTATLLTREAATACSLDLFLTRRCATPRASVPSSSLGSLRSLPPSTSRSRRPRRPSPSQRRSSRASMFNHGPVPFDSDAAACSFGNPLPSNRFFDVGPIHVAALSHSLFYAYPLWPTGASHAVRRRWLPRPSPAGPTRSTHPTKTGAGCLMLAPPATTSVGHSTHRTTTSARPTSPALPHRRPLPRFVLASLAPLP